MPAQEQDELDKLLEKKGEGVDIMLQRVKHCEVDSCRVYYYKRLLYYFINNPNSHNIKAYTDSALKYLNSQISHKIDIKKNELHEAHIYNELAIFHSNKDYAVALNYNNKARMIYEKHNDLVSLRSSVALYDVIYSSLNQLKKSEYYALMDRQIIKKLLSQDSTKEEYKKMLGQNHNNVGVNYLKSNHYAKGIIELKQSLKYGFMFKDTGLLTSCYMNLAAAYHHLGVFRTAHAYTDSCLMVIKKSNQYFLSTNYVLKAKIYNDEMKLDSGIANIRIGEKIAMEANMQPVLKVVYQVYATLYESKHDYKKALVYFKKYSDLKDTVFKQEALRNAFDLKEKYESEKKEKEILKLTTENNIKQLEIADERKAKNLFLTITVSICVFFSLASVFFYVVTQNRRREANNAMILNKQEALIAKYQSQMNPHFIFNALSNLQNFILKNKSHEAGRLLLHFTKLMRKTLSNSDLDYLNLNQEIDYLNTYFQFERSKFDSSVNFNIEIDGNIEPENTLILPMLIQPFIENSFKHGSFLEIVDPTITLTIKKENDKQIKVKISDNGKGLKQIHDQEHQSKALEITKQRIMLWYQKYNLPVPNYFALTNNYDIDNNPSGITVNLLLPLVEKF